MDHPVELVDPQPHSPEMDDPMDCVDPEPQPQPQIPMHSQHPLQFEGLRKISEAEIGIIVGESALEQVQTRPQFGGGGYFLSSDKFVTSLVWRADFIGLPFVQVLCNGSWRLFFGAIRNQYDHLLCWDYAATDLASAESIICGWESHYFPLSAWHVCANCRPDLLGKDHSAKIGHRCYGYLVEFALRHIQIHGVPREIMPLFRCDVTPPIPLDIPLPIRFNERIRAVRRLETLEEALFYLPNHPIGADVIVYPELFEAGTTIYHGPGSPKKTGFLGYHAVIIESVFQLLGDLVAVCRMSNGDEVAHCGYAYVSLTTMYMIVGLDACQEPYVRKTPKPMHLLSNFVILEMHKNSEKSQEDSSIIGTGDVQSPIINQDVRTGAGMPVSKDFLKGADKNVSACLFDHPKDMDGAERMRQIKPTVQSKYKD
ncbi:unnamed protein product [Microthlaspi erraticum]|uniref:Uncharacterized protein n=1 Tax=Microthlaspi erraticum TaxID=1685480 RepID=A0A6D2IVU0_9BRAS|nr:unnamed protein product [Microthlaspi erraticum]